MIIEADPEKALEIYYANWWGDWMLSQGFHEWMDEQVNHMGLPDWLPLAGI